MQSGGRGDFSPLQLNPASPVFCCCDNQETEGWRDRQRKRGKKTADQLAWQQQRCNPTRHTLINAPSADGLLRINKKEASGHATPQPPPLHPATPPHHHHHHHLSTTSPEFPPNSLCVVTCQHSSSESRGAGLHGGGPRSAVQTESLLHQSKSSFQEFSRHLPLVHVKQSKGTSVRIWDATIQFALVSIRTSI